MTIGIYALVFQRKQDGNIVLSCGLLQQDPDLLANMLTALRDLSEEAVDEKNKHVKITFHHFGGYFVFLLAKDDFYVSIFTEPMPLERISEIGEIFSFASEVADIFKKVIWDNISEEEKELGLIPDSLVIAFERDLTDLVTSVNWSKKIKLSERFITSKSGINVLKTLYHKLLRRIENVLGSKLVKRFLDNIANMYRDESPVGELRLIRDVRVKPILIIPEDKGMSDGLRYLSLIYVTAIRRIKNAFISNALSDLDVISMGE